jgi:hypothetical protein
MRKIFTHIALCLGLYSLNSISAPIADALPLPSAKTPQKSLCRIEVDYVHPSTYFRNKGIAAIKVNARSVCDVLQQEVVLTVQIFKVGFLFDHLVSSTTTDPIRQSSTGLRVENNRTSAHCKDSKVTKYYGIAFATAVIAGQKVQAPPARSIKISTIPCGT